MALSISPFANSRVTLPSAAWHGVEQELLHRDDEQRGVDRRLRVGGLGGQRGAAVVRGHHVDEEVPPAQGIDGAGASRHAGDALRGGAEGCLDGVVLQALVEQQGLEPFAHERERFAGYGYPVERAPLPHVALDGPRR